MLRTTGCSINRSHLEFIFIAPTADLRGLNPEEASGEQLQLSAADLPKAQDGHALTWGQLFDVYQLTDEDIRLSLEATLHLHVSHKQLAEYREQTVPNGVITIILKAPPASVAANAAD